MNHHKLRLVRCIEVHEKEALLGCQYGMPASPSDSKSSASRITPGHSNVPKKDHLFGCCSYKSYIEPLPVRCVKIARGSVRDASFFFSGFFFNFLIFIGGVSTSAHGNVTSPLYIEPERQLA
jgi:hypothetical protein